MKTGSKVLLVAVIAAFLVVGTAAVLPHLHSDDTLQHACWISQARQMIGSPTPEAAHAAPPVITSHLVIAHADTRPLTVPFLPQEIRAPPLSSF
ncbi:MAG: hypothetical protein NC819_01755 [Candidatus Omnitrophica bacterium]|nr:hypothetical protein [Candidatus Omnitrophota bacterium]